jgi:hypothetical protein
MARQDIKPRYEVEQLQGTRTIMKYRRNMATGMNEQYEVEVPAGFFVYFPAGHSIRVDGAEELHRLGYDNPADLVDMENGDVVGQAAVSLKQQVQRRAGTPRRPDAGAVDANIGG